MHGADEVRRAIISILLLVTGSPGYPVAVWFLAGVFAWSGSIKLRRPRLAALAIVDFSVGIRRARRLYGLALGGGEVLLAIALAVAPTRIALAAAAVLLSLFTLLLARSVWSGVHFACFCFGETEDTISALTVARTSALMVLAWVLATAPVPPLATGGDDRILAALAGFALLAIVTLLGRAMPLSRYYRAQSEEFSLAGIGGNNE